MSSCTEDTRHGEGGRALLIVGNLIVRNMEQRVCDSYEDHTMTCLPGVKLLDITSHLDRLVESAQHKVAVVVYVSTNNVGKCNQEVLEGKFRL